MRQLACHLRAWLVGAALWLIGAAALAEEGPVLPGLDALPPDPQVGAPPKPRVIPRSLRPLSPSIPRAENRDKVPEGSRGIERDKSGPWREQRPIRPEPPVDRAQPRSQRQPPARGTAAPRSNTLDPRRRSPSVERQRPAVSNAPDPRLEKGGLRPLDRAPRPDPRALERQRQRQLQRSWNDPQRRKTWPSRQDAPASPTAKGAGQKRSASPPSNRPQAGGAKAPARWGQRPAGRSAR